MYKVASEDLELAIKSILAFSPQSSIPTAGVVGFSFTMERLRIRIFNGVWAWCDIPIQSFGEYESRFVALRENSLRVLQLQISKGEEYIEFDVGESSISTKGPKLGILSSWTEDDLSPPAVGMVDAVWHILPQATKELCRVSLSDPDGPSSNLYISNRVIFAVSAKYFTSSCLEINYPIDDLVAIPGSTIGPIARSISPGSEASFAVSGDKVLFYYDNVHVVSNQGYGYKELPWADHITDRDSMIVTPDAVSDVLLTELQIAKLQSDNPIVFLWGDEDRLKFFSPGSEVGSNKGEVWGRIDGLKYKGRVDLILRALAQSGGWRIGSIHLDTKKTGIQSLMVEYDGCRHVIMPIYDQPGEWEAIIGRDQTKTGEQNAK